MTSHESPNHDEPWPLPIASHPGGTGSSPEEKQNPGESLAKRVTSSLPAGCQLMSSDVVFMRLHGQIKKGGSFMGDDPANRVTLVVWTNLPVSLDGKPTANSIMLKVLDQVYVDSPLR